VSDILKEILAHHNPFPAFVLDRRWNIKMKNDSADAFFKALGDPSQIWKDVGDSGELNIALLTVHPKGLRQYISNWNDAASPFITRLKKEAIESEDPSMLHRFQKIADLAGSGLVNKDTSELLPVLPLEFKIGEITLKLCSVISTFGTAQDITSNELRIETFYPADESTRHFFKT
jgi:hypothetical protein